MHALGGQFPAAASARFWRSLFYLALGTQGEARGPGGSWMVDVHVDVGSLSKGGVRPPVVSHKSYVTQLVAELGSEGLTRMCCIARSMSSIALCSHGRDSASDASLAFNISGEPGSEGIESRACLALSGRSAGWNGAVVWPEQAAEVA